MNYNHSKSNKNINSNNDNKWNNDKFSKTVTILLSVAHRRFVCKVPFRKVTFRKVPFRKVPFRFVSLRFAKYRKPVVVSWGRRVESTPFRHLEKFREKQCVTSGTFASVKL